MSHRPPKTPHYVPRIQACRTFPCPDCGAFVTFTVSANNGPPRCGHCLLLRKDAPNTIGPEQVSVPDCDCERCVAMRRSYMLALHPYDPSAEATSDSTADTHSPSADPEHDVHVSESVGAVRVPWFVLSRSPLCPEGTLAELLEHMPIGEVRRALQVGAAAIWNRVAAIRDEGTEDAALRATVFRNVLISFFQRVAECEAPEQVEIPTELVQLAQTYTDIRLPVTVQASQGNVGFEEIADAPELSARVESIRADTKLACSDLNTTRAMQEFPGVTDAQIEAESPAFHAALYEFAEACHGALDLLTSLCESSSPAPIPAWRRDPAKWLAFLEVVRDTAQQPGVPSDLRTLLSYYVHRPGVARRDPLTSHWDLLDAFACNICGTLAVSGETPERRLYASTGPLRYTPNDALEKMFPDLEDLTEAQITYPIWLQNSGDTHAYDATFSALRATVESLYAQPQADPLRKVLGENPRVAYRMLFRSAVVFYETQPTSPLLFYILTRLYLEFVRAFPKDV